MKAQPEEKSHGLLTNEKLTAENKKMRFSRYWVKEYRESETKHVSRCVASVAAGVTRYNLLLSPPVPRSHLGVVLLVVGVGRRLLAQGRRRGGIRARAGHDHKTFLEQHA